MSKRNPATLGKWGPQGTRIVASESMWKQPLKWDRDAKADRANWDRAASMPGGEYDVIGPPPERPRVFCASLADVFEDWQGPMLDSNGARMILCNGVFKSWTYNAKIAPPDDPWLAMADVRKRLFSLIDATPNLDWLILSKRPENFLEMLPLEDANGSGTRATKVLPNAWLGVSVENQEQADKRIPLLLQTPAAVRFLSCEPLLSAIDLTKYFGYNPIYEINRTDRSVHLRSGEKRPSGDISRRNDMEGSRNAKDSNRQEVAAEYKVPEHQVDAKWSSSIDDPSKARVFALQGADPARVDSQSYRRGDDQQSSRKSGTGDVCGTSEALDSVSRPATEEPGWRKERHGQAEREGCSRDSETTSGRGAAQIDSDRLRDSISTGIENRAWRPLGSPDLVIIGGESGHGARPCSLSWIRDIVRQCKEVSVAVFCKQIGSQPVNDISIPKEFQGVIEAGGPGYVMRLKDKKGGDITEFPEDLRVREFPTPRQS